MKKDEKERTRRQYAVRGERNQKMMSFRVDNENIDWLMTMPNKGRYINDLIAADQAARKPAARQMEEDREEEPP